MKQPSFYSERAVEAREHAKQTRNPAMKQAWEDIAAGYEELAINAERAVKRPPKTT